MYCLQTKNLEYQFSNGEAVLNNINIQVPEGSIYGFLGPNGAGKTTTLRLMLGLLKKQRGEIEIFNQSFDAHRVNILKNIGSLIETPALYAHLSAKENLAVWQKLYQCPVSRIGEVLSLVGLASTGTKRAGQFSLGMKQRLSIAVAMLNQPKLLLLDEPTNGLDPNGIVEMRELLKRLNRESGMTILVSSHLLAEIERMVTDIGIIHKGRLLFQGKLVELYAQENLRPVTIFSTSKPDEAMKMLTASGYQPKLEDGRLILSVFTPKGIMEINKLLVQHDIPVFGIRAGQADLEEIFMKLIES